jgi:hypothetical protein
MCSPIKVPAHQVPITHMCSPIKVPAHHKGARAEPFFCSRETWCAVPHVCVRVCRWLLGRACAKGVELGIADVKRVACYRRGQVIRMVNPGEERCLNLYCIVPVDCRMGFHIISSRCFLFCGFSRRETALGGGVRWLGHCGLVEFAQLLHVRWSSLRTMNTRHLSTRHICTWLLCSAAKKMEFVFSLRAVVYLQAHTHTHGGWSWSWSLNWVWVWVWVWCCRCDTVLIPQVHLYL